MNSSFWFMLVQTVRKFPDQMKITIRTLSNQTFQLEITPEESIPKIKSKISEIKNIPTDQIKLIFSGKVLDTQTVGDLGLKEGDFMVMMVTKVTKQTPVQSSSAAVKEETKAEQKPKKEIQREVLPPTSTAPVNDAPAITTGPEDGVAFGQSALVSGSEYEKAVAGMVEMGFDRAEVVSAMKAAFNNPDRAAEYLMTGIPSQPQLGPGEGGESGQGEGDFGSAFESLSDSPQFQQLRQLIQNQPQLLEPLLAQIGQSNPQLLQLINEHPEEFMNWLSGTGTAEGGEVPEGAQVVRLTQDEVAAVDRLVALGFDRNMALEAYLACDKNEQLAANYLFDSMNDYQE